VSVAKETTLSVITPTLVDDEKEKTGQKSLTVPGGE